MVRQAFHPTRAVTKALFIAGSLLAWVAPQAARASSYGYILFDFPGATLTDALGINDSGQIVGVYTDSSGQQHGFLKEGDTFANIDVPGATVTYPWGINDAGQIVGTFYDASGGHGYVQDGATYTPFDVPGAYAGGGKRINSFGQIVGSFIASPAGPLHGFLKDGETYSTIDFPDASGDTVANGINDAGQIVGDYFDGVTTRGFLKEGADYVSFDSPYGNTFVYDINNMGQIVGSAYCPAGSCGFLKEGGTYTAVGLFSSIATGINDSGDIVGYFSDGVRNSSFLAVPIPEPTSLTLLGGGLLALSAWRRSKRTRSRPGLALGRGFWQYTSVALGLCCRQAGVRPWTGRVGDAYDNAMAESFFATLE